MSKYRVEMQSQLQGFRRDFRRKLLGALVRGKACARCWNQQERRNQKMYF